MIPDALKPVIEEHLRTHTDREKDSLLFADPRSGGYMRENSFNGYWRLARAEVPRLESMHFHDLRHTALQRYVENGATLNMVMKIGATAV